MYNHYRGDVHIAKLVEGCDADVAPARIVVGESLDQKQSCCRLMHDLCIHKLPIQYVHVK